jgi:tRNA G10  N-methylase Trm11
VLRAAKAATAKKPKKPRHPAKCSDPILPVMAGMLEGLSPVLDPFAGVGRIHELPNETVGVEIEPEWAAEHPDTQVGNALDLPFDDASFAAIATSPTYGNRLADSHDAKDPSLRRSYTHDLRAATGDPDRALHPDNSGTLQWGTEYRQLHQRAWKEALRVLKPGGRFVLNISDHVRDGERQYVAGWHVTELVRQGLTLLDVVIVETQRLRHGENSEARAEGEWVVLMEAGRDDR